MTKTTVTKFDDVIDTPDIIARVEELERDITVLRESEQMPDQQAADDAADELATLSSFLETLKGQGGDEQWRGDWYPVTLVRDSYFKDYAQELAEGIGAIPDNAQWPCTCIDWERAARELRMDYTSAEFDGETYWFR